MRGLRTFFDFYISSSIHVALSVLSLSSVTLFRFDLPFDENVLCFIFFASVTGYNFVKFFGLAKFHHRSLTTWLKVIQVFSAICFFLMAYYALQLKIEAIMLILILALITFLYAVPILPRRFFMDEAQQLRSISGLKVYLIAFVWAGVTVVLPLANANYLFEGTIIIVIIQRFLFVLALMLPFEIRDLNYDSLKLATIPQRIGVKRTKFMGFLLLMAMFFLELVSPVSDVNSIITTGLIAGTSAVLIYFSKIYQNQYYSSFLVEAIPILWLVLVLVF